MIELNQAAPGATVAGAAQRPQPAPINARCRYVAVVSLLHSTGDQLYALIWMPAL